MKTNKQNTNKNEVSLPKNGYYTIKDLLDLNSTVVPITLRVRVKKMIDAGTVTEIGTRHLAKGRPEMVLATTPVAKELLEKALAADILLNEKYSVTVANVSSTVSVPASSVDVPVTAAV